MEQLQRTLQYVLIILAIDTSRSIEREIGWRWN